MASIQDVETIVGLGAAGAALVVGVSVCCTLWCLKKGCCGPRSLSGGDVEALTTFSDIYRYQQIDIPEGYFDKKEDSAHCRLRRYTLPAKPVLHWSSLLPGSSCGFLVDAAKKIDQSLLAWQHRMWNAKGDFACQMPTFMVAQEWREWAMSQLQKIEEPLVEHRDMISRRVQWIANAREVARTEIMELRETEGWDETDDLSLLSVMRKDIGEELKLIHAKWDTFQLQLAFERQANMVNGVLVNFVRSGVQFLLNVLCQDKMQYRETFKDIERQFHQIVEQYEKLEEPCNCCSGFKQWKQHALGNETIKWARNIKLMDEEFPGKFRTMFFTEERLKELEAGTQRVRPLKPLNPFSDWDDTRLDFKEMDLANEVISSFSSEQFGLKEQEFQVMVKRGVTLLSALKHVTVSIMVLESLKHFAVLGGALFLAEKMSSEHILEILKFVGLSVESAESDVIAVADLAQTGWSNIRRGDAVSPWSDTGPTDNVRRALHVKTDMVRMAKEVQASVKVMKKQTSEAEKVEDKSAEQKLRNELNFHLHLWELLSKHFEAGKKKAEPKMDVGKERPDLTVLL